MRNIGTLERSTNSERLSNALFAEGIDNEVREDDGARHLWVLDDARVQDAKAIVAVYLANPADPRFDDLAQGGKKARAARKKADKRYNERLQLAKKSMHGAGGQGYLTMTLLVLSIVVALASGMGRDLDGLRYLFLSTSPPLMLLPEVRAGEVWRLVTPVVMHFGVMHLGFNMMMWWSFGQRVEARKGLAFFLPFFLVTAVLSNLGELAWGYWTAPLSYHLFGGMSGVLYGLFGYQWVKGRFDPTDQLGVTSQTTMILMGWLVLCMTGILGPVANAAHVCGLVVGAAWAWLDIAWFAWRKRR